MKKILFLEQKLWIYLAFFLTIIGLLCPVFTLSGVIEMVAENDSQLNKIRLTFNDSKISLGEVVLGLDTKLEVEEILNEDATSKKNTTFDKLSCPFVTGLFICFTIFVLVYILGIIPFKLDNYRLHEIKYFVLAGLIIVLIGINCNYLINLKKEYVAIIDYIANNSDSLEIIFTPMYLLTTIAQMVSAICCIELGVKYRNLLKKSLKKNFKAQ